MHQEIIFSGFGGQGALFAGQLLAYAALDSGLQVTWIPSYGPEMRGGTAHCTVVVADEPIGSPLVHRPVAVVALNLPSFEKYEPRVKPGGLMVYNESLVPATPAVGHPLRCRAGERYCRGAGQRAPGERGLAWRVPGSDRLPPVGGCGDCARQSSI